jgi:hypothetical protein
MWEYEHSIETTATPGRGMASLDRHGGVAAVE